MAKGKYLEWISDEGILKIEGWARDGLTDEQIAKNMGIRRETLYAWIKRFPNISNALKKGKDVVDRQVENALLKRALGYSFEEETYISVPMNREEYDFRVDLELAVWNKQHPNANQEERDLFISSIPNTKEVLEKKVKKQVAPDTTAQIFWLKNRKPIDWRDKKETELSGGVDVNNPFANLTTEELRKLARSEKYD